MELRNLCVGDNIKLIYDKTTEVKVIGFTNIKIAKMNNSLIDPKSDRELMYYIFETMDRKNKLSDVSHYNEDQTYIVCRWMSEDKKLQTEIFLSSEVAEIIKIT